MTIHENSETNKQILFVFSTLSTEVPQSFLQENPGWFVDIGRT